MTDEELYKLQSEIWYKEVQEQNKQISYLLDTIKIQNDIISAQQKQIEMLLSKKVNNQ